jgi:hypothetical protein
MFSCWLQTYWLHDALSSLWEANSCSASQEISCISCKPKVYYCVRMSPPLSHILSQKNPLHNIPVCILRQFWCHLFFHLGLGPSGFPIKIVLAFLIFHIFATSTLICSPVVYTTVTRVCVSISKRTRYWNRKRISSDLSNVNFLCLYLILGDSALLPGLCAEQRGTNLAVLLRNCVG